MPPRVTSDAEKNKDQPKWVTNILASIDHDIWLLDAAERDIDFGIAQASIGKAEIVSAQFLEARHEIRHAREHLTSIRRGLRMSWPEIEEEGPAPNVIG